MGKFEDVTVEIDHASVGLCTQARGWLGLDVTTEEDARTRLDEVTINLTLDRSCLFTRHLTLNTRHSQDVDADDQREIVLTLRAKSWRRPQHIPARAGDIKRVPRCDRDDFSAAVSRTREQLSNCGHRGGGGEERVMHDNAVHARLPHHIEKRAVVIKIGMRYEDGVDAAAARFDSGNQTARGDTAVCARTTVIERGTRRAINEVHRSVADGEHGDHEFVG